MAGYVPTSDKDEALQVNFVIRNPTRLALFLSLSILLLVFVRNAWIGDDAFITMRVVDNAVNGYGLVWNVGERVQAYTHPLWTLLLIPLYALTRNPYLTLYGLSLVVSMLTVGLVLTKFTRHYRESVLVSLLLLGSMAFVDYSFSGLENPLTHLLLVALLLVVFKATLSAGQRLFWVALLASLAAVNRLDAILLYLPVLGYTLFEARQLRWKAILIVLAGFLPLILWLGFATFYYGFPLPNTYYAKLKTGIKTADIIEQGKRYFENSIHWDPLTLTTIGAALVLAVMRRTQRHLVVAAGIGLYLLYVLMIGGDFMAGRFFAAPFLVAIGILLTLDYRPLLGAFDRRLYGFTVVAVVVLAFVAERPPLLINRTDNDTSLDKYGIANEKLFYYTQLGMLNQLERGTPHEWAGQGVKAKTANESPVSVTAIGSAGYYAGPTIYIIDTFALTDPLRARLPVDGTKRVGHYERRMPAGYKETLTAPYTNKLQNPALHEYYDKLLMLTQGDLMAPDRWREILKFNLGRYDALLATYLLAPDAK